MDQHELITNILLAAGGQPPEAVLPSTYKGKRADAIFKEDNLIAEVKSLTADRTNDPQMMEKIAAMFARNTDQGAPVVFGTVSMKLSDFPKKNRSFYTKGTRKAGNYRATQGEKQICQTQDELGWTDTYRLIVFVTPPRRLGHQNIRWLISDAVKESDKAEGLDGALIFETPLCFPERTTESPDSFSCLWSISGRPFPSSLASRIGVAWEQVTSQRARPTEYESFISLGATE